MPSDEKSAATVSMPLGLGADHSTFRASTALRARHQLSAATATAPGRRCTEWTPGIAFTSDSLVRRLGLSAKARRVLHGGVEHPSTFWSMA